ncbi:RNA-binding domain-containing protein [Myriangium duriaei CBS 260.36]|uniref:RNA-binding domain-containing protein n=1 Tax=Myriangium duriaei CBS 260.36 TaxID=1168546 RepID=A0A9P4J2D3_9PEZI|nr:RNA-binding domain-containing protein [Myriangium duriaei CBS 260.36]
MRPLTQHQIAAPLGAIHVTATAPVRIEEGSAASKKTFLAPAHNIRRPQSDGKLRVENIHYELLEPDLRELFSRIGPLSSVQLLYDRHDRPTGTAFVTYHSPADARDAVREFDGANAYGQPIRVALQASAPADRPARSLFDRIESSEPRRRPARSVSPAARKDIDRYVPPGGGEGRRDRSPIRRRGTPREGGRRPGERAPNARGGGRGGARGGARGGGRGGGRTDSDGRPLVGGRPRKTAEELDAEMNDYWGSNPEADKGATNGDGAVATKNTAPEPDVDLMIE